MSTRSNKDQEEWESVSVPSQGSGRGTVQGASPAGSPEVVTVHFLHHGQVGCGFSTEVPGLWPPGNVWAGLSEWDMNNFWIHFKQRPEKYEVCEKCNEVACGLQESHRKA